MLKRLVENADDDKPTTRARRGFRELLEEVDVGAVSGSAFEEFSHLVDNQQDAVTRSRVSLLHKTVD